MTLKKRIGEKELLVNNQPKGTIHNQMSENHSLKISEADAAQNTAGAMDVRNHPKFHKAYSIAMVCHEANRVWCFVNGDQSQRPWPDAEEWQRDSAVKGVLFRLENSDAGHDAQHNAWMQDKINDGWVYGEVKDAEAKTHPCIVPFDQLPEFQQKKDAIFAAIVDALK
jgi:hypothetical protein